MSDHWSSPNGCHPDCPACAAEEEQENKGKTFKTYIVTEHTGYQIKVPTDIEDDIEYWICNQDETKKFNYECYERSITPKDE